MIYQYVKFIFRIFLKDRFFSILNILGLSLGIAVSIIVILILNSDLNYDKDNKNYKRIYRLGCKEIINGNEYNGAETPYALGPIVKNEISGINNFVRIIPWGKTLVKYQSDDEKSFYEENIIQADSSYFSIFTAHFIAGNSNTCLSNLNSIVLTRSVAEKYFGDENPINRFLLINNEAWKVTAVINDLPENTHLKFGILLSMPHDESTPKSEDFWSSYDVFTYLLFNKKYGVTDFYSQFPAIYNKYFKSFGKGINGEFSPVLEPLTKIHFYSTLEGDFPHGNITYLYSFAGIGFFIILLACINYINLSTAKATRRAKELSVKKALGSGRWHLIFSVLSESILLSYLALIIGIGFLILISFYPELTSAVGLNFTADIIDNKILIGVILLAPLFIGILSGLYPSIYLTGFSVKDVLKGGSLYRGSGFGFRRILIVIQFSTSLFVILFVLFMNRQIHYIKTRSPGFDRNNILVLPIEDTKIKNHFSVFKNRLFENPDILSVTAANSVTGIQSTLDYYILFADIDGEMTLKQFALLFVGDDFFKTLNLKIINGRTFSNSDNENVINSEFIANETAVKQMGWVKNAIGEKIKFYHAKEPGTIIGVVNDFNFNSLYNPVEPLLIRKTSPDKESYVLIKYKNNLHDMIKYVDECWKAYDKDNPFEYFMLNQRMNDQYDHDEAQFKILSTLSVICIFISMLGLMGLSAYNASRRTREIGIRKVLGADVGSIVYLLYKEIMILVIIAIAIVIPFEFYTVNRWLDNFAFHINVNYYLFIIIGLMTLLFTFIIVSLYSIKTAKTNPVEILKYE